jgi:hypothetical protein
MDSHEIAAKYDERDGYELVSYAEVAMPIFRIAASALIQSALTFSPIEEFTLRLLETGLTDSNEISGFLGLDQQVLDAVIIGLIQNVLVRENHDGSLELTVKGRQDIAAQRPLRPKTETITFYVDGLTRNAYWHRGYLNTPRDVKDLGLVEIRAIPMRRPNIDEVEVEDVDRAIQIALGKESGKKVLRLREVFKSKRFFYDATVLVFRNTSNDDIQMAFAIDGRISAAHELAFAKGGGLKKSGIAKSILASLDDQRKIEVCGTDFSNIVNKAEEIGKHTNPEVRQTLARAKLKAETKLKEIDLGTSIQADNKEYGEHEQLQKEIESLRNQLNSLPVRNIPVYEHPPILDDTLTNASKRVLIISPWITSAVVNSVFLRKIRNLLDRGVELTIGYGIEETPKFGVRSQVNSGEMELKGLAAKYDNFTLSELGDTHAKILIKDSEYYVVTSFNWLSFRGDPRLKFREEWGTLISIQENVDEFFSEIIERFPVRSS